MKTWDFIEQVIRKNNMEADVFAAKGWDKDSNSVLYDPEVYDANAKKWLRDPAETEHGKPEPSSWELFEAIEEKIAISKDDNNGLVAISAEHYSPYVAQQWVDILIRELNTYFQTQDRNSATQRITYLEAKIAETSVTEMRNIFYEIIQEQTQTLMLAEISDEYVLKTLSPAKVAEKKSKPSRAVIVVLSTILGGFFGIFIILIRFLISVESSFSSN
jgi:hypothetical protein